MAKKTSKQTDEHLEKIYRFKWECLRRNPEFISDVKSYWESLKKNPTTIAELDEQFFEKYGICPPEMNDLHNPEQWHAMDGYDIVSVVPDRKWYKCMPGKTLQEKSKNWQKLIRKDRSQFIKHILKSDRFLTLRIDTSWDKPIVERALSKKLGWIRNEKKRYGLEKIITKAHLKKSPRYFAVWDLVQERQKVWPYNRIVLKLKEDGWYKKLTEKQAENLARQDYRTACKIIGVPVKGNKLVSKRMLKPIIKLKGAQRHKELFREWEKKLVEEGLGLEEGLKEGLKEDLGLDEENSVQYYQTDSSLKKKLKSEMRTKINVQRRGSLK